LGYKELLLTFVFRVVAFSVGFGITMFILRLLGYE
jgi:hypothetical protein